VDHRKNISRGTLYGLLDPFSLKADNYDANGVNKIIGLNIPRFDGKGYGIRFLLERPKSDDEDYYEKHD
jgi:hypothetical protein